MILLKKIAKAAAHVGSVILVVIEVVLILFIIFSRASGEVPTIFGHSVYVIVSPSMTPELEVGDIIVSKQYDGGELAVGDVVEYVAESGAMKGNIITHKIISVTGEGDDRVIVTKGTANTEADAPIRPDQVVSVMVYKTVIIDKLYGIISNTAGFLCLVILPLAGLVVFEIIDIRKEMKKEMEDGQNEDDEDSEKR